MMKTMQRWLLITALAGALGFTAGCLSGQPRYMDGDIVFQDLPSPQSQAVAIATGSQYTHCGMILIEKGEPVVLEAVGPVRIIPLEEWIAQGENAHFVVKRLKNSDELLTENVRAELRVSARPYMGKPYDIFFEWSNERIYCSELVWKMYNSALSIEVGERQELREFNLEHPIVATILQQRFPDGAPMDEPVISPAAIFDSDLLVTVHEE